MSNRGLFRRFGARRPEFKIKSYSDIIDIRGKRSPGLLLWRLNRIRRVGGWRDPSAERRIEHDPLHDDVLAFRWRMRTGEIFRSIYVIKGLR